MGLYDELKSTSEMELDILQRRGLHGADTASL